MPEQIILTTPVTKPSQTLWKLDFFNVSVSNGTIDVSVLGDNGENVKAAYPTPAIKNPLGVTQPTGAALISILNTSNNTTNSMAKKILQQLQTDGYIGAGSVTGTPS